MKILYIITKGNWGGAQRYVYDMATSLHSKHDVLVISGPGALPERLLHEGVKAQTLESLQRDPSLQKDLLSLRAIFTAIRSHRPDVVHLNSSKIGILGSLACRIASPKTKIIFTSHGWGFNEERPFWQRALIWVVHFLSVLLSHKTILVSQSLRPPFAFFGNKLVHIPLGIGACAHLSVDGAKNELLSRTTIRMGDISAKHPLWIGTIGELHKNKGQTYLIKALAKLKFPFIAFLIGEGEEREKLTQLIKTLELENTVFLVGAIPEAASLLKAFDIFVLPSITESFGYVILEAGMAQRPVIASQVGGIPEIITQLQDGILTKSRSQKELAAAIEYAHDEKDRRMELARKLREKVLERYKKEHMVSKTEDLYRQTTSQETHSS